MAYYQPYYSYDQPANQMGQMAGQMAGQMNPQTTGAYGHMAADQPLSTGFFAAFGTSGYPGEPSLLEELGVNFSHITQKTKCVLHPFGRIDQNIMDDADLAGPIIFFLLFGLFLLLTGKPHFGYIYGVGLLGTGCLYVLLNLMALKTIDFMSVMSVLGYCMLPLVATSALGIFVALNNIFGYAIAFTTIAWCTWSSSAIFVSYLQLSQMRALVAYPLALFYGIFSLMTLFADAARSVAT